MNENITPEAIEAPASPENEAVEELDKETTETPQTGNAEAAKWRKQLRAAEAQLTEAHGNLASMQKQLVQQHLAHDKANALDPAAIDDAGLEIASIFAEGTFSEDELAKQLDTAKENKPWLFKNAPLIVPAEGGRPASNGPVNSFADAFSPSRD